MLLVLEECFQEGSALLGLLYNCSAWTLVSTPNILKLTGVCQQLCATHICSLAKVQSCSLLEPEKDRTQFQDIGYYSQTTVQ